eukprot:TRINITY_DN73712_c0_g1_i1.p1 TRINITY_DN73712_c0_g1~~TRINITY_DN73712_c0_g1_i1.p1  ORF type:complete len:592 (+),score=54.39 TRINITY_DN73712_c0_g1_i1:180-1778(+)
MATDHLASLRYRRVHFDLNKSEHDMSWCLDCYTMNGRQRLLAVGSWIERADFPEGHMVEAGAWRGGLGIYARAVQRLSKRSASRVFVCDSFQGFPQPTVDVEGSEMSVASEWHRMSFFQVPMEDVSRNYGSLGMLSPNIVLVKGFFQSSLPGLRQQFLSSGGKISILYGDGDMYESFMDILYNLYDFVSIGGYFVCDDCPAHKGAMQAILEFRRSHGITEPLRSFPKASQGRYWRKTRDVAVNRGFFERWSATRVVTAADSTEERASTFHGLQTSCDLSTASLQMAGSCPLDTERQVLDMYLLTLRSALSGSALSKPSNLYPPTESLAYTTASKTLLEHVGNLVQASIEAGVYGDVIDAGAGLGGLGIYTRALQRLQGSASQRIYACDVFSSRGQVDRDTYLDSYGLSGSLEDVQWSYHIFDMLDANVYFVKGPFAYSMQALRRHLIAERRSISLLYVDCEHSPRYHDCNVAVVLESLFDLLIAGGYFVCKQCGASMDADAAVESFRAKHGIRDALSGFDGLQAGRYLRKVS